ncbi:hypothetical protein MTX20_32555 [Bradyrhizobium sp. ISRA435]|nr:hypothetical protein MTX20_32555 [Bradyrhizobium sp. ISRA435]
MAKKGVWAFAMLGCVVLAADRLAAFPLDGRQTLLPVTTELNEDALIKPREAFHSELHRGHKSYLVNLGDLAFNSPSVLGGGGAAGRHELRDLPCERCCQPEILHAKNVRPSRHL